MQSEAPLIATTASARAFPSSTDIEYLPSNAFEGFEDCVFDDDLRPLSPSFLLNAPPIGKLDIAMDNTYNDNLPEFNADSTLLSEDEDTQVMRYMQSLPLRITTPQPTRHHFVDDDSTMLLPDPPPSALEDDSDDDGYYYSKQAESTETENNTNSQEQRTALEHSRKRKEPDGPLYPLHATSDNTQSKDLKQTPLEPENKQPAKHMVLPLPAQQVAALAPSPLKKREISLPLPLPSQQQKQQQTKVVAPPREVKRLWHTRPVHHIPLDTQGSTYSFYPSYIQEAFVMQNAMLLRSVLLAVPDSTECKIPWREPQATAGNQQSKTQKHQRLTVCYADPGVCAMEYIDGNVDKVPALSFADEDVCPRILSELRKTVSLRCGVSFDLAVLNYYPSAKHTIACHADDLLLYGGPFDNKTLATVSIGAECEYFIAHKSGQGTVNTLLLPSGSLFVMEGQFHAYWKHSILARKRASTPRVSVTFHRSVKTSYTSVQKGMKTKKTTNKQKKVG